MTDPWGARGPQPPSLGRGTFGPGALGRDPRQPGPVAPPDAPGRRPDDRGRAARVGRDGPVPRHLNPVLQPPVAQSRQLPTRRRGLNWLIAIPTVLPLLVPLYNRDTPRLFGLPFFYWFQLACVLLAMVVVTFVYLLTKGRRPRWPR